VVVRLSDGRQRSIPRSSTNLANVSRPELTSSNPLGRVSVRTLLTLLRHLNCTVASRIEEVIRDEHSAESGPRSVGRDSHEDCGSGRGEAAGPLGQPAGGDAKAVGAERRATAAGDEIGARAGQGGPAC
jgi:hypothetical protein